MVVGGCRCGAMRLQLVEVWRGAVNHEVTPYVNLDRL